jgi:outer membrane protein assembly factor BamB
MFKIFQTYASFWIFVIALPLLFGGCASDKKTLPGERTPFLKAHAFLERDKDADSIQIIIADPVTNTEWSQVGGNAMHAMQHVHVGALSKILWKTDIVAGSSKDRFILSGPVVADGLIYTMDARGEVGAFDALTGKKVWSADTSAKTKKYTYHGGGVSFDAGKVFASTLTGEIWALEGKTGKVIWQHDIGLPLRTAPTVHGNRLFVITTNNRTIALDVRNGEKIWHHDDTQDALGFMGGGNPTAASETEAIIPYSSGNIFALRAENGHVLWQDMLTSSESHSSVSMISQIRARPIVDNFVIFITSQNGHMMAVNFLTGERLWEKNIGCIRTPAIGDNVLFAITTSNDMVCLTKDLGKILWMVPLPKYKNPEKKKDHITWAGPVLAGNRLLITGTNGQLLSLSPETGKTLDTFETGHTILLSPVVANGIVYILQDGGSLIAVQ